MLIYLNAEADARAMIGFRNTLLAAERATIYADGR